MERSMSLLRGVRSDVHTFGRCPSIAFDQEIMRAVVSVFPASVESPGAATLDSYQASHRAAVTMSVPGASKARSGPQNT